MRAFLQRVGPQGHVATRVPVDEPNCQVEPPFFRQRQWRRAVRVCPVRLDTPPIARAEVCALHPPRFEIVDPPLMDDVASVSRNPQLVKNPAWLVCQCRCYDAAWLDSCTPEGSIHCARNVCTVYQTSVCGILHRIVVHCAARVWAIDSTQSTSF